MPEEAWDGEERRQHTELRGVFGEVVERAAARAAQKVGAIHRRRLVVQAFLAAVFVSCGICISVVLYTNDLRADTARANSEFNCKQSREYADVFRDFIDSDAELRHKQRHYAQRAKVISGFARFIDSKLLKQVVERSDRLERETIAEWRGQVARLNQLVAVNCAEKIK